MTKKISLYFATILLILFSILSYTNVSFASQEKTVRVGYFINEGFQNAAENGTYSGYGYEYLQNLAEYTNWNYEYVEASWRECFTLLENGEIDIMGFVHKTPTREEKYSFPNFNSGFNETKLLTSQYNTTLAPNAYEDYNGINIGVLNNSLALNQLRDFANSNSFTYTETTYSSTERMYTGLKMGEVDAICTNLAVAPEHTRILSLFELQPFYYIVNKNNTELLNELNNAIYQLKTESPYLEDDLKKKYFTSATDTSVIFSSSERAFIENHEPLLVLVDPDFMPIEGFDKNSNIATGFSVSLLDKISQMSGLKFEYTYADAYADAEEMIMNCEIDILSSVNPKYVELEENLMSDSYLNSSVVLIGKQNFNLDNKGVIVAMTKKSAAMEKSIAKIYPDCLFIYYNSGHEAYDAVLKGSADLIARNLYSAQAELFTDYKDLKIIYDLGDYANFRFAFSQEMPDVLASIFNKCLKSISEADKNGMMVSSSMAMINTDEKTTRGIILFLAIVVIILASLLFVRLRQARQKLEQLAYYDELTGLRTLSKFKLDLKNILHDNPHCSFMLVISDIADFSFINEQYGFEIGNEVLKAMSKTLTSFGDEIILVSRVSGDTFASLCIVDKDAPYEMACFAKFNTVYSTLSNIKLSLYVGRYYIPTDNHDVDDIYEKANYVHSYARKQGRKNEIVDYDDKVVQTKQRNREIEALMEGALTRKDYHIYLQPKYRSDGINLVGAEALVRWKDSISGNMIFPDEFIPLFEQNGFVKKLDMYMFEEVCKIMESWKKNGLKIVSVSVNFSRLHFTNEHFADELARISSKYDVEPKYLEIEITENALSTTIGDISGMIRNLHMYGFKLSMDDFSSKHSSMSFLADVTVDVVKLDREFVKNVHTNMRCNLLVSGTIGILKKLGINIVAEGIETLEQVVALKKIGCDIIQGYVFSRPVPVNEFNIKLEESAKAVSYKEHNFDIAYEKRYDHLQQFYALDDTTITFEYLVDSDTFTLINYDHEQNLFQTVLPGYLKNFDMDVTLKEEDRKVFKDTLIKATTQCGHFSLEFESRLFGSEFRKYKLTMVSIADNYNNVGKIIGKAEQLFSNEF